jgi:hypothetical protein
MTNPWIEALETIGDIAQVEGRPPPLALGGATQDTPTDDPPSHKRKRDECDAPPVVSPEELVASLINVVRNSAVVGGAGGGVVVNDVIVNAKLEEARLSGTCPVTTFQRLDDLRRRSRDAAKKKKNGACQVDGVWVARSPLVLLEAMGSAGRRSFPLVREALEAVRKDAATMEWLSAIDPGLARDGGRCTAPRGNRGNRGCNAPVVAGVEVQMCCLHRFLGAEEKASFDTEQPAAKRAKSTGADLQ